jgi:hypothetical protein
MSPATALKQKQQEPAGSGQKVEDAAPKGSAGGGIGSISWQGLWGTNTTPAASFGSNYLIGQ